MIGLSLAIVSRRLPPLVTAVRFIGKASLTIIVESIGYDIAQIGFANADIFTIAIKLYWLFASIILALVCVVSGFNLADHVCNNWVWSDFLAVSAGFC